MAINKEKSAVLADRNDPTPQKTIDVTIEKQHRADGTDRYMAQCRDPKGELIIEFGNTEEEAINTLKGRLYKVTKYVVQIPEID